MFMMTTVLERLHTTKCSGFLGSRMALLTVMSVPADVPRGLKVLVHSVVFTFHTWHRFIERRKRRGSRRGIHLMVMFQTAEKRLLSPSRYHRTKHWRCGGRREWMWPRWQMKRDHGTPSDFYPTWVRGFFSQNTQSFNPLSQKERLHTPLGAWSVSPTVRSNSRSNTKLKVQVYLMVWSKEALRSWLLSLQKLRHVTPLLWARSNLLRHWPLWIFQTYSQKQTRCASHSGLLNGFLLVLKPENTEKHC